MRYRFGMDITFDPAKDSVNQTKHGLSLAFDEVVIADAVGVVEDDRNAWVRSGLRLTH